MDHKKANNFMLGVFIMTFLFLIYNSVRLYRENKILQNKNNHLILINDSVQKKNLEIKKLQKTDSNLILILN
jgi:hypothetical protein